MTKQELNSVKENKYIVALWLLSEKTLKEISDLVTKDDKLNANEHH